VAKAGKKEGKEADPDFGSSDEEDADDDKYADAADAVGQKLDTKTRITVRNLRIREDTAKYLMNLDPESAYYDPKTRSMRDAPMKNVPAEDVCIHTSFLDSVLNDIYDRRNLPEIISFGSLARLLKSKNYSFSRGKRQLEEMMFISTPIPRKVNFFTMNLRRRRK
jgi:hypothetical protein